MLSAHVLIFNVKTIIHSVDGSSSILEDTWQFAGWQIEEEYVLKR